jgi:hypothetical protein
MVDLLLAPVPRIGLVAPPNVKLKPIPEDELREGWEWMARLSKDYGFKPGSIKSKSTQSYTRGLTTACIRAVNRYHDRETCFPASETYNAATGRSGDILGIVDAIVMEVSPTPRNRWVQACGRDWQSHITKMADYDHVNRVRQILANPTHCIELWGWAQYPGFTKGGRAKTQFWYPRVQIITLDFILGQEPPRFVRFWES